MLLTISWRNIWRHPGRSGVLLAAIIAGLWAGVVVVAWANGLVEQRIHTVIQTQLSHGQIHHPQYRTEREPSMFIDNADAVMSWLENDERVQAFAPRTLSGGMLQSPVTTSGVSIYGVDVATERNVTTFHQNLTYGDYLDIDTRNPVLIGERLADKHNLDIGHRIVLNFQDINNELTSASFNIVGFFRSASSGFDESTVYVRSDDLSPLLSYSPVYHEIGLWLENSDQAEAVISDINSRFEKISAETWYGLSPEMRYITDSGNYMVSVIIIIIMLALAFGILNTMLMAIFERMRELAMLLAIGMSKLRVFTMIMLESIILTLTGAAAGLLTASLTVAYLAKQGIDLTMFGDGLAEWGYDAVVYPVMMPGHYSQVAAIVVIAAILASVYPAYKAIQLNPIEVEKE